MHKLTLASKTLGAFVPVFASFDRCGAEDEKKASFLEENGTFQF